MSKPTLVVVRLAGRDAVGFRRCVCRLWSKWDGPPRLDYGLTRARMEVSIDMGSEANQVRTMRVGIDFGRRWRRRFGRCPDVGARPAREEHGSALAALRGAEVRGRRCRERDRGSREYEDDERSGGSETRRHAASVRG